MLLKTLTVGPIETNCYILAADTGEAAVIDPGAEADKILAVIEQHALAVQYILLTHYHFDHTGAVPAIREATGAPVCIHARDAQPLAEPPMVFRLFAPGGATPIIADRLLKDDEVLLLGALRIACLPTPGHSPGGVTYYLASEGVAFCGDALFAGGVGRIDFVDASSADLIRAIRERLYILPPETIVYPGHGPHTTIAAERSSNPFVRP